MSPPWGRNKTTDYQGTERGHWDSADRNKTGWHCDSEWIQDRLATGRNETACHGTETRVTTKGQKQDKQTTRGQKQDTLTADSKKTDWPAETGHCKWTETKTDSRQETPQADSRYNQPWNVLVQAGSFGLEQFNELWHHDRCTTISSDFCALVCWIWIDGLLFSSTWFLFLPLDFLRKKKTTNIIYI